MLVVVDDQNNKCLFYGSTLQKSVRQHPPCSTIVSSPTLVIGFNQIMEVKKKFVKVRACGGEILATIIIDMYLIMQVSFSSMHGCDCSAPWS
jgi:hypothetical protein